ncbi:Trans-acting enoyl reductase [Fusarium oxysporum f. sp. cubense race 1]|uniref:Trans-acting enoyl reductase n=1 Tax=Fusarium oxysporum f. sp. cubense (strain race 1) TaxID=1229664 RepID=N4U4K8_FUSC1|nr:Trans-acting enoyl reductase [Fusarium oxysporum f. sp. cubense race 1]
MSRDYELVLLGATGHTGKLAAEHLTKNAPTNLRWALAGRSESKLNSLASDLQALHPNRIQPAVELFELEGPSLTSLAKRTQVIVSTVGPFMKYGTPVVEACARNGTHYVDCSAEIPWHKEMIERFDTIAKASGAIIIPQTGSGSAPPDLTTYLLAAHIRKTYSSGTLQVTSSSELKVQPSAGSMDAVLSEFDIYGSSQMAKCREPFALSPVQHRPLVRPPHLSSWTRLIGIGNDEYLGPLTDFEQSAIDKPLVERSWGLLDDGGLYGPNFQYDELKSAPSIWSAFAGHVGYTILMYALSLAPVRWLLRRFSPIAQKDAAEAVKQEFYHNTAVAIADTPNRERAIAKSGFDGSIYLFTGICITEAALTLLRGEETYATKMGGGFLTSATLGHAYIGRLRNVGVRFEILDDVS